ncbi:Hypothetical predicted protein [Paramuricea clavata]|uniref:Uncharacterized protein n=1 Tax=Paramuricea clavata TaxID=317549 RepID=A0A6S7HQD7_PARCT|nr:Hypothetical predicted protein [Paramuricea clavata]
MSRKYQNFQAECRTKDEQIVAGVKLWMTSLNAGEELKCGGSDKEIAQLLHDAYVSYKKGNIREACNVLVFINDRFIDVYDHVSNETLLTFRLIDIKDVTKGQDRYSKFSVLVAKEYDDTSFKAYIFYNKKTPACFYNITRRAFQLGFHALKKAGSTSQYSNSDSTDSISRTRQLDMYNTKYRDKTNYGNYGLCCETSDISDSDQSDDEFEWYSEQTCLLHPHSNMAEFHQRPKQSQRRSSSREKACFC